VEKKTFSPTIILLIAITVSLFSNITQAKAQCNIIWWGTESGYAPTLEYEATETATSEALNAISGVAADYCQYTGHPEVFELVCANATFGVYLNPNLWSSLDFPVNSTDSSIVSGNGWDVVCTDTCDASGGDSDIDGICDDVDNCLSTPNHLQQDADDDGAGDICDDDTLYGYVHGDGYEGITVKIYILSCGMPQPHANVTTDSSGYYSIGNLGNARYLVGPENTDYSFAPIGSWVDIPQAESQFYNFTATTSSP
jgi:hypothetical protein